MEKYVLHALLNNTRGHFYKHARVNFHSIHSQSKFIWNLMNDFGLSLFRKMLTREKSWRELQSFSFPDV